MGWRGLIAERGQELDTQRRSCGPLVERDRRSETHARGLLKGITDRDRGWLLRQGICKF